MNKGDLQSSLRQILDKEDYESEKKLKIIVESLYSTIVDNAAVMEGPSQTPGAAKNILETQELVIDAIKDYDKRTHATKDASVVVTYENPDVDMKLETISISLARREPGAYAQGRPFEGKVRNLRPLRRDEKEDPDNPGYRRAILGFFYDNILRLTCWARTNKAANDRALWLENVMEEYTWFFRFSGVARVLYHGRRDEIVKEVSGNKIYGRPIDYFVRTEKLRAISMKEIEEICVRLQIDTS
jgi:hypothetical protein